MLPVPRAFRDPYAGACAAVAALLAMGGVAVTGLLLLDAGRVGPLDRLTAAVACVFCLLGGLVFSRYRERDVFAVIGEPGAGDGEGE